MIMNWRAFGCFVASSGMRAIHLCLQLLGHRDDQPAVSSLENNTGGPSWSLLFPGMANRHLIAVPYMPASGVSLLPFEAGTAYARGTP